ncbi:hypothetical protein [Breoghania sp. JC706]|uniref:hypothetical protein n=1 Tax=Breoghania sp. JC706 TaxID=3117732 RepID=UPI00300A29AA
MIRTIGIDRRASASDPNRVPSAVTLRQIAPPRGRQAKALRPDGAGFARFSHFLVESRKFEEIRMKFETHAKSRGKGRTSLNSMMILRDRVGSAGRAHSAPCAVLIPGHRKPTAARQHLPQVGGNEKAGSRDPAFR